MKLIPFKEGVHPTQPDPYIIKAEDGKYYIYATGSTGVHAYVSDSLTEGYEYLGIVFSVDGKKGYWAPSVIYTHGKYYMYVSFMGKEDTDPHKQAIHVAVSDDPHGPFKCIRRLTDPFSIDAHVVENQEGMFMFYSVNDYEAERAGTYIVVDRMDGPEKMVGSPVSVLRPTLDEEIFKRNRFKEGQHWHTLEGAFYFREGDTHYLIYSGNCYENEYYYLGYATAKTDELDLTKVKFNKYPSDDVYHPLISANSFEAGTGHNSVIKDDGVYYAVYHGRDIPPDERIKGEDRTARICRIEVCDGLLSAKRYKDKV